MWVYIVILICSAALILGISGCIPGINNKPGTLTENDSLYYPEDSCEGLASRQDVIRRLEALAKSETPQKLQPGAMCYAKAPSIDSAEYICPVCGAKTQYVNNYTDEVAGIPACRQTIAKIRNLDLRLDESSFCRSCTPDTAVQPSLVLCIKYKGEDKEVKSENISVYGLIMISELMAGKKIHKGSQDSESPLKDNIDILRKILKIEQVDP